MNKRVNPAEAAKAQSDYLRGTIREELQATADTFASQTNVLLKHHGMYQQEDRDQRVENRRKTTKGTAPALQGSQTGGAPASCGSPLSGSAEDGPKGTKSYSLMVRTKVPGGRLTSEQLLAELDLCDELGNGTLRVTNRQNLQLHGVLKRNVRQVVRRINQVQLSTLAACGDVVRNIVCCPAPYRRNPVRDQMQALARQLNDALMPHTPAYRDIWLLDDHCGGDLRAADCPDLRVNENGTVPLDASFHACGQPRGDRGTAPADGVEPLYGPTYLPRKFKISIGLPDDNCVDLYSADVGLMTLCEGERIVGYNLLVGGSHGFVAAKKETFPALARPMAMVTADRVADVLIALCKVHRDYGNREDRRLARLKYIVADWGVDRLKAKVEEYLGAPLADPWEVQVTGVDHHLGWQEQGDGRWFLGLKLPSGRIADRGDWLLKTAIREVCRTYRPEVRLTPQQNILFANLAPDDRDRVEVMLRAHGVRLSDELTPARCSSMACVSLPTCPLAVAEAERVLPAVIRQLEHELSRLGLRQEPIGVRMSGCGNGCARPYNAEIGLVGRTPGKYAIYIGGSPRGDRLGWSWADQVPLEEIVSTLLPLLKHFQSQRQPGEAFGDFCHRQGRESLTELRSRLRNAG